MKRDFQKIIWAADPLEDRFLTTQSLKVLRDLSQRTKASIEPVYVLSDGLLNLALPKSDLTREFKPASERALARLVARGKIATVGKPTVLVSAPSSRGSAAEALDRYARNQNADVILVNSHGRSGLKRALLGSFAETLMLHSKTPVLIAGPNTRRLAKLDSILFPTDFSKASKRAFAKVQQLARRLGASVTIMNVVVDPIEPFVQSGAALLAGGFVSTPGIVKEIYARNKKTGEQWAAEARANGIDARAVFDVDSSSVILSILHYAGRKRFGMIAMASESGAVSAALLGSVGRGVAREAPCPVWFLRA
ncbi:MAG: universal stress protein [Deltaproteobacteria bacterium]|nr:universal stress protein [Deltaproteobacteria bacterium]